jgi:hypothetical protein
MSICNLTTTILSTDNIGSSRITINTNFSNLDTAACTLSTAVSSLQTQINNGSLKGTPGLSGDSFFAPVGTITMFGGTATGTATLTSANNWLLCDGSQYQHAGAYAKYNNLYNAIGMIYNRSGETDPTYFRVPNLVDSIVVGANNNNLGSTGTLLYPAGTAVAINYLNLQYFIKY